ncbi:hypothetical protein E4U43_004760, partial [Claviceps pusilla]
MCWGRDSGDVAHGAKGMCLKIGPEDEGGGDEEHGGRREEGNESVSEPNPESVPLLLIALLGKGFVYSIKEVQETGVGNWKAHAQERDPVHVHVKNRFSDHNRGMRELRIDKEGE